MSGGSQMRTKVITLTQLGDGNSRMCLSTDRQFGKCFLCNCYGNCKCGVESDEGTLYAKDITKARVYEKKARVLRDKWMIK